MWHAHGFIKCNIIKEGMLAYDIQNEYNIIEEKFVKIFHDVYEKFEQNLLNEVAKQNRAQGKKSLEALAVDNGGSGLVVLLLGDPHLLEGREGGEDGTTDPYRVLSLGGSNDLDLHTVSNTRVHGGTTGQDSVGIQVLTDINIALHDGVVSGLVDATGLHSEEGRLEEGLRATESLIANGDNLTVGKLIGLLKGGGGRSSGHLSLKVKGNIAQLLLDITDNLALSGGGEGVATLSQDLHQVVGELTASQVKTKDGMGKGITFIDGDGVGNTITRVHDDTSGTTGSVQGEDSLDGNVHGGHVEGLKHNLSHLFSVGLGVKGSLSEQDRLLLRGNTELVVEGVMPDLLHIIPVGDNTVLNGVLQGEDTSLGLSLVTDIGILLTHTDHDTLVAGTANNGGEDSSGSVITCETGLAHAGAVVNDKGGHIFVTHGCCLFLLSTLRYKTERHNCTLC